MCSVDSAVRGTLALGTLGASETYFQQEEAEALAEQQHDEAVRNANMSAQIAQNNLEQQALEQSQSVANERENLEMSRRRALASARVAGAESGVSGVSALRNLSALNTQAGGEKALIDTNVANQQFRTANEAFGIERDRANRLTTSRASLSSIKQSTGQKILNTGLAGMDTVLKVAPLI